MAEPTGKVFLCKTNDGMRLVISPTDTDDIVFRTSHGVSVTLEIGDQKELALFLLTKLFPEMP